MATDGVDAEVMKARLLRLVILLKICEFIEFSRRVWMRWKIVMLRMDLEFVLRKSVGESEGGEVVQDCVQTTPPDEVLGGVKIVDFSEKMNVGLCGQRQAVRRTPSPGSKVLKGCSRTKLFGNPNSFSYRRLLPFLMDITKGALKSFDMKPLLLENAGNSAVENSLP